MRHECGLREIQGLEYDILLALKRLCDERNIKYSLGAGTMIGSVRHGGFIPWDDDIDIFMVRAEYEKFLKVIRENGGRLTERYQVKAPGEKNYVYPFIKIIDLKTRIIRENIAEDENMGIWIDIFPVDFLDGAVNVKKYMVKRTAARKQFERYFAIDRKAWKKMLRILYVWYDSKLRRRGWKYWRDRLLDVPGDPSKGVQDIKYAGTVTFPARVNDLYPAEYFDGYTEMQFEDEKFPLFKKYDLILSHRYGDYMMLPKEKERVTHKLQVFVEE